MIDVHSHILPLVDDGSQSFEESIKIIQEEIKQGVTHIVCTPHVYGKEQKQDRKFQIEQFQLLKEKVKALPVKLILGAEVYYHFHIQLDLDAYVFENTNIVLMEFSTVHDTPIEEVIFNFQSKGYQMIVAHIERYSYLSIEDIQKIRKTGALIQMNSSAVIGSDHYANKSHVKQILKHKLVDIIATDTHNMTTRKPLLANAYKKLKKYYEPDELDLLFNRINFNCV
ncbi:MAG: CpsB/CapC family capsule biosynthesis tyrosine phosphatase [Acholeplasmataceae bacterium]